LGHYVVDHTADWLRLELTWALLVGITNCKDCY
jgi:hypothetical protein